MLLVDWSVHTHVQVIATWHVCHVQDGWDRRNNAPAVIVEGDWALLTCTPRQSGPSGGRDRLQLRQIRETPLQTFDQVLILTIRRKAMCSATSTAACMLPGLVCPCLILYAYCN